MNLRKKYLNQFGNEYEIIGEYIDTVTPVLVRCSCGYEYSVTVGNFKSGKRCPKCNIISKGENQIIKLLDSWGIDYEYQYRFDDCKKIYKLPFDFFISKYNLCIEYDGEQHFKPIDFAGRGEEWANERFKQTKINDSIKDNYCNNNGINMLRIPYLEYDNIGQIIYDKINSLK